MCMCVLQPVNTQAVDFPGLQLEPRLLSSPFSYLPLFEVLLELLLISRRGSCYFNTVVNVPLSVNERGLLVT